MNPQELRIGNLINVKGKISVVDGIRNFNYLYLQYKEQPELLKYAEPIPLTEEWLLKFGFVKVNHKHLDGTVSKGVFKYYPVIIDVNRLEKEEHPFSFCRIVPAEPWKYNYFTFIKYVHQLQNLFLDLTGIELEYQ